MKPMVASIDEHYMRRTFELARKAEGKTSPNPMVGCVLVKKGKVIAEGYHKKAGSAHAEIAALQKAGPKARGATLYVSLEPCCHHGRTDPCVDPVIASGVRRVVIAIRDPNPLVRGRSIRRLKAAGIMVKCGVLAREAERLNEVFFTNMKYKRPFVAAKAAQTLDGKIASPGGESKWITASASRRRARSLRGRYDAILVGAGTALKDNPSLDTAYKRLVKVIIDPDLKLSPESKLFPNARSVFLISKKSVSARHKGQFDRKAEIIPLASGPKGFSLRQVLAALYRKGVTSLFVEGGSATLGGFFDQKLVDKLYIFIAPKIMGKSEGLDTIGGCGPIKINCLTELKDLTIEKIGSDYFVTGYPCFAGG
ncbi:bifunctional diaminohydroxyphosphoribosylaminopyrimidine deaminase/5-amino-6-(5-phosphoribosylamino)uracil reductase RibD [Candidatus Omnitrophota bacterium]